LRKPLVPMPTHVEQAIAAHDVARLGPGVAPPEGLPAPPRARQAIGETPRHADLRTRAQEVAQRYGANRPREVAERIGELAA